MTVPDFQSIMLPFLQTLEDGAERSMREMGDLLAANFYSQNPNSESFYQADRPSFSATTSPGQRRT